MAAQTALAPTMVMAAPSPLFPPVTSSRPRLPVRRHTRPSRASAEGPAVRPLRPTAPTAPVAPTPAPATVESSAATAPPPAKGATVGATVTMEFQRQMAKELVAYFQEKKLEEQAQQGGVFGWTRKNEIGNGRWVMFGLLVGILTEYATGVNFPSQIAIVFENLGVID